MKRDDSNLYAPLRDTPPVSPEDAMSWPFVVLLVVLLCVFCGMTAAFLIENWPLIVAAFSL